MQNILISLAAVHADNIFSGKKKVEFRRRTVHVELGSYLWIYQKVPFGAVRGRAKIAAIHTESPASLWKKFSAVSGLEKSEFFSYFEGQMMGCALVLEEPKTLANPLDLSRLRELKKGFHPPQFFIRLTVDNPILKALRNRTLKG